jgi:hypothetical protein
MEKMTDRAWVRCLAGETLFAKLAEELVPAAAST